MYTGVWLRGRAGELAIVLLGRLRPPEARPGRKFQARPVRRTFAVLPYRNHKEKCEKIGKFPQDLPPPRDLQKLAKPYMIFRKNR